jgi:TonB family protein
VNFDDEQCLASQEFGPTEKPITLAIRPAINGESYELLLARTQPGPKYAVQKQGSVDFGSGRIKAWVLNYGGKGSKGDIHQFRIPAANMAQAHTASSVTLRLSGVQDQSFALTSMPAVMKGLADCTADLRQHWNVGGQNDGRIASLSRGDVRGLFKPEDYPAEAQTRGQGGDSQFMLLIDEKGVVAGCHVLKASGIPAIDAMGCKVIRDRARFTPALDSDGKPVRSTAVTPPIVWRLQR